MSANRKITIRMGGYGPATTCFSRSLKMIGDDLAAQFGDALDIKYVYNIMDLGYRAEDILWLVEDGLLTLGYQSSSYLSNRIPEIGVADLPFLFRDNAQARAAIDGELGAFMTEAMEANTRYRILGYFENGFRHISNRLRPVRTASGLDGMRIRVLPSDVQAKTFALLGAAPLQCDLTEALAGIAAGTIDAQENPLANTVTYGAHKYHRFHTLTGHFYVSRPIFLHRPTFDAWPADLQEAMRRAVAKAIAWQRGMAEEEDREARLAIEQQGCEVAELDAAERATFVAAVQPLLATAQASRRGEDLLTRLRASA